MDLFVMTRLLLVIDCKSSKRVVCYVRAIHAGDNAVVVELEDKVFELKGLRV